MKVSNVKYVSISYYLGWYAYTKTISQWLLIAHLDVDHPYILHPLYAETDTKNISGETISILFHYVLVTEPTHSVQGTYLNQRIYDTTMVFLKAIP